MNTINTHQIKDMVGEILQYDDEVTFQANGGEQSGRVKGFQGLFVQVLSARGYNFKLPPSCVMTDRGADRIVKEAEARRVK